MSSKKYIHPLESGVRLCGLLKYIPWKSQANLADLFGSVREGGRHAQASPRLASVLPIVAVTRYNNNLIASFSAVGSLRSDPRPAMFTRPANTAGGQGGSAG